MWMSHGDKLHAVPDGFKAVGTSVLLIGCRPSCCLFSFSCYVCLV